MYILLSAKQGTIDWRLQAFNNFPLAGASPHRQIQCRISRSTKRVRATGRQTQREKDGDRVDWHRWLLDLKLTIMSSSSMPTGESTGRVTLSPSLFLSRASSSSSHASEKFNYCAWMNHCGEAAASWHMAAAAAAARARRLTRSLLRCLARRAGAQGVGQRWLMQTSSESRDKTLIQAECAVQQGSQAGSPCSSIMMN